MDDSDSDYYSLEDLSEISGYDRRAIRSFIEQGLMRGANSMGRYANYSNYHLNRLLAIKVMKEEKGLPLSSIRTALVTMSEDDLIALIARNSAMHFDLPVVNAGAEPHQTASRGQSDSSNIDFEPTFSHLDDLKSGLKAASNPDVNTEEEESSSEENADDRVSSKRRSISGRTKSRKSTQVSTALDYIKALQSGSGIPANSSSVIESGAQSAPARPQDMVILNRNAEMRHFLKGPAHQPPPLPGESRNAQAWGEPVADKPRAAAPTESTVTGQTPIDLLLQELSRIHEKRPVRRQAKGDVWYRIAITPDIELSVRGIDDDEQLARLERVADYLREILLGVHYE